MRRLSPLVLAFGLVVAACSATGSQEPPSASVAAGDPTELVEQPTPLVVDTDMGADDIIALTYLLNSPEVDVRAITVAGTGLARCDAGVTNALSLLEAMGAAAIPVACGSVTPTSGTRAFPSVWRDEADAFYGLPVDPGSRRADSRTADELISDVISSSDTPAVILTLGPLTNLAAAITTQPGLLENIDHIYSMGGAVDTTGNVEESPADEWNFFIDPAAARTVLGAATTTLVPLDASDALPLTPEVTGALASFGSTSADLLTSLITGNGLDAGGFFLWDPLAAATVVDESVAAYEMINIAIGDSGTTTRSETGPAVRVATEADADRFTAMLAVALADEVAAAEVDPAEGSAVPRGRLVWKTDLVGEGLTGGGAKSRAAIRDGSVYFVGYDGALYSLDAATGEILWTKDIGQTRDVFVELAASDDALFYQAFEEGETDLGTLVAVNRADGSHLWQRTFAEEDGGVRTPTYSDGRVFSGTTFGGFFAVDATTGEEVWAVAAQQATFAGAAAIADGVVYFGDVAGSVHALDGATGDEVWTVDTRPSTLGVTSTPAVDETRIYFGSDSGQILAVDKEAGEIVWEIDISPVQGLPSSPVIADGVVYIGVLSSSGGGFGGVLALDADNGAELWRWGQDGDTGALSGALSSPALEDGVLYFGDLATGNLVALEAASGDELWTFPTGPFLNASPIVSDGVVYVQGSESFYAVTAP